jgi:hypothetical protein
MSRPCFLAILLLVATSAAGCKSRKKSDGAPAEQTGPSGDRVVLYEAPGASDQPPLQSPEWFEEEIKNIVALREDGRLHEALQRIYAAKEQRPSAEVRRMLDALLGVLNSDVLRMDTLKGRITPAREPVEFGDPVVIHVVLENVGLRPIRIPAQREGTTGSVFVFEIERFDHDTRAQVVTTARRIHRPLRQDLDLAPGGSVEVVVDLGPYGNDQPLEGFRVYLFRGLLRPTILEAGGLQRWDAIELVEGRMRSFRANYQHLTDDPVGRIRQAIEKRAGLHLLTAAALVSDDRRTEAVDLLVDAVRGNRRIDWAMFAALQYLTELDLGRDGDAWRAWWLKARDTWFAPPIERAQPDQPAFGD